MPSIKKREWYPWPVHHIIAKPLGKPPETFSFEAHFKALKQSEVDELNGLALKRQLNDEEFVSRILAGWGEVQDADGTTLGYTPEAVALLRETYPGIMATLGSAWTESVQGGFLRKN